MKSAEQSLNCLSKVIRDFNLTSLKSTLHATQELFGRPGIVDVAIFGRFKAGKSSFINHILKSQILPIGVVPVTAVVTRLRYGPVEKAEVRLLNGEKKAIPLSDLSEYISESKNHENQKNVSQVDIELPALKVFEGLEFVDTPGLGSAFKHNTETSLSWLPHVGVALVAIGVDPPLSEQDISLIKELQRFTPRIAILLTKVDLVSTDQQLEVIFFIKTQLKDQLKQDFEVWPFSTQQQFDELSVRIEEKLFRPLNENRTIEAQKIGAHKLKSLNAECMGLLSLALKASESTDVGRKSLAEQILGEKNGFEAIREEFQMLSRGHSGKTRPFIVENLLRSKGDLQKKLTEELVKEMTGWKGSLWDLSRRFEDWLGVAFARELSTLSIDQTGTFLKPLNDFHASILRAVTAFQSRLAGTVEVALGVELKPADFNLDVKIPAQPDISFSRTFDTPLDLLSFLIPVVIFRKLFERHFLNFIEPEVEKNLSRLASQWAEAINKSIFLMVREAEVFCKSQLEMIQSLLKTTSSSIENLKEALIELERLDHQL